MNLSISNSFFNEKFKDYIRNFYVYGCVPDSDFPGSIRTYRDDFSRIESIGYIPLSDGENDRGYRWRMEGSSKCLRLITSESRELNCNPVHIFYRLHESRETEALFFLTVMLLAAHCRDTGEDLKIDQIMSWTDPNWRAEWDKLCHADADSLKPGPDISEKELERRRKESNKNKKTFRDKTQAVPRKRMLQEFGDTGLLDYHSVGNNNIWNLRDLTLDSLLHCVSDEEGQDLLTAIDFFMKLGPFGEIGDMLLSRMGQQQREKLHQRSICLNQFYLCKSLNDYNSIDILKAIHGGNWIIVTYHHPQTNTKGYVLCRPLKLRSSVTNGREYLGYYDPVRRQARYIRLEFIQSVEILDQRYVPWLWAALRGTECAVRRRQDTLYKSFSPALIRTNEDGMVQLARYTSSGSRIQAELCFRKADRTPDYLSLKEIEDCRLPDPERMEAEISKAGDLLNRAWGASVPYTSGEQTMDDLKVHVLTMTLYVWAGEEHIRRRLIREARNGICRELDAHRIRFEVEVLDPWEMLPWISSFAGRIKEVTCTAPAFEDYLRSHLQRMHSNVCSTEETDSRTGPVGFPNQQLYQIPNLIRAGENQAYQGHLRGNSPLCRRGAADHELLFSPLYSVIYQNCFAAFDRICGQSPSDPRRVWRQAAKQAKDISVLKQKALDELMKTVTPQGKKTALQPGSAARFQQMLPQIAGISTLASRLQDVSPVMFRLVPLSVLEREWLLAIFQDPLIEYFLKPETVDVLSTVLKEAGTSKPLYRPEDIDFFDRYRNDTHSQAYTKRYFRLMRTAVKNRRSLHITYRPVNAERGKEMDVLPIRMEYAARDNAFRILVQELNTAPGKDGLRTLRLERIEDVRLQHGPSRIADGKETEQNRQEYILQFSGEKNMPDRILTHFAPWQKQCTKSGEDDYQLRFWADESEWMDIMIRIMSFGHLVKVRQPTNVAQEIRFRLERQKNMWM